MFATSSNFEIPPYNLPNLDKVSNIFPDYVDSVEEEALLKLLGRQLYDAFIDGLEDLPDDYDKETATVIGDQYVYGNDIWEAVTVTTGTFPVAGSDWTLIEADNKWLELKNGAEYEYNGKTWKWNGLVKLFVPLIASRWMYDNADSFTGNGVVVPSNENSTLISPALRICRANNDYAEKVGVIRGGAGLYYGGRSYRYEECLSTEDTLYGFLVANRDEYEVDDIVWMFCAPELMNIAGI